MTEYSLRQPFGGQTRPATLQRERPVREMTKKGGSRPDAAMRTGQFRERTPQAHAIKQAERRPESKRQSAAP
jgi:hypothetical protein